MVKRAIALGLALTLGGTLAGCGGAEEGGGGGGGGGDTIQEDEGAIKQRPEMRNEGTERRGTPEDD